MLTDFGIAKIVTGVQFTSSGRMVGTPPTWRRSRTGEPGDERSDLYSLGVILFQFLTGRLPYDAETPLAVVIKHVNEPIPSVRDFAPHVPEELDRIVQKALAKDPDERYQSATELANDLARLDIEGRLHPVFDSTAVFADPPLVEPRPREDSEWRRLRSLITDTGSHTPLAPPATSGAPGRMRPRSVLMLAMAVIALAAGALYGFGDGSERVFGLLGLNNGEPTDVALTSTAMAALMAVPTATEIRRPWQGSGLERNLAPAETPSPVQTPLPTDTPRRNQPTHRPDRHANLHAHAGQHRDSSRPVFRHAGRRFATPNMTQTLTACDFEYYVEAPEDTTSRRSARFSDPRLVRSGTNFTFDLTLLNTGSAPGRNVPV